MPCVAGERYNIKGATPVPPNHTSQNAASATGSSHGKYGVRDPKGDS